jgi:hypothetical protein
MLRALLGGVLATAALISDASAQSADRFIVHEENSLDIVVEFDGEGWRNFRALDVVVRLGADATTTNRVYWVCGYNQMLTPSSRHVFGPNDFNEYRGIEAGSEVVQLGLLTPIESYGFLGHFYFTLTEPSDFIRWADSACRSPLISIVEPADVLLSSSDNGAYHLVSRTFQRDRNFVRFWFTFEYVREVDAQQYVINQWADWPALVIDKARGSMLVEYSIDCLSGYRARLALVRYDANGQVSANGRFPNPAFEPTIPGSVEENLVDRVCMIR